MRLRCAADHVQEHGQVPLTRRIGLVVVVYLPDVLVRLTFLLKDVHGTVTNNFPVAVTTTNSVTARSAGYLPLTARSFQLVVGTTRSPAISVPDAPNPEPEMENTTPRRPAKIADDFRTGVGVGGGTDRVGVGALVVFSSAPCCPTQKRMLRRGAGTVPAPILRLRSTCRRRSPNCRRSPTARGAP